MTDRPDPIHGSVSHSASSSRSDSTQKNKSGKAPTVPDSNYDVPGERSAIRQLPIAEIKEAVERVRHGTVQLVIQDGRIVQIDTLEKRRLV